MTFRNNLREMQWRVQTEGRIHKIRALFQCPRYQPQPPVLRRPGDITEIDHCSRGPTPTPGCHLVDKSMFALLLRSAQGQPYKFHRPK